MAFSVTNLPRCLSSRYGPYVAEPQALERILAWFRDFVARNCADAPTGLAYVLTTRGSAHSLFADSSSIVRQPDAPAVLLVAYGRIVNYSAKGPWPRFGDGRPPSGAMLYAICDAAEGFVMQWGIRKEAVDLTPLGELRTVQLAP
jgi:hypothetical protein